MAIYMIGYDLHPVKGENYDGLFAALEAMGTGIGIALIRHGLSQPKGRRPK